MNDTELVKASTTAYTNKAVGIERRGEKIVLPEVPHSMHERTAIDYLTRKLAEDEKTVSIRETVDCHPLEGAWALKKVLEKRYGWAEARDGEMKTFFGTKKVPPALINLEVAYEKYEQVLWGGFGIPGVEAELQCSAQFENNRPVFCISGQSLKKYQPTIAKIANEARAFLKKHSLYKGQAIRLPLDADNELNLQDPPRFLDLSRVNEKELIFSETLLEQVKTNLFTPVENTDLCRKHGIPLKRGVLLEGTYGTGKTLAAYVTAKKGTRNGWTFIYLEKVAGLQSAIEFARRYEPCIIFAEDIDREMGGTRDVDTDEILNTIDGIQSKNSEIMVVLTSNDVRAIEKAMLRPGRLDAVITFTPPDAAAAEKLVRLYARGLVDKGTKLTEAGRELAGTIPAVIREVVERSKLYAISRGDAEARLTDTDIAHAARGMKAHLALLEEPVTKKTAGETFAEGFCGVMKQTLENGSGKRIAEYVYQEMNQ